MTNSLGVQQLSLKKLAMWAGWCLCGLTPYVCVAAVLCL